ncbi:MAG: transposase IS4 family protein [Halanaerobium sp.]|nr:MAG: transposase IS4 family protein [Halanaerobium sp.]
MIFGYNPEAILRAFLVQQIEKIPTRADLVSKIDRSPYLRYVCGFSTTGRVPSEATFSRYYKRLSETDGLELLMNDLLDQSIELNLLDTDTGLAGRYMLQLKLNQNYRLL